MSEKLKTYAAKHGLSMEQKSKKMEERDKKVVCKSFHKAGIVVPVDENEVGYREVPETPGMIMIECLGIKLLLKTLVHVNSRQKPNVCYCDI